MKKLKLSVERGQVHGELLRSAHESLRPAWATGNAAQAATALFEFVKTNEAALKTHMPEGTDFRAWARSVSDWLYSTDHITVGYGQAWLCACCDLIY